MATSTTTYIKKITVGVPIRKVTGAEAQTLSDITDVTAYDSIAPGHLLIFDATTQKWKTNGVIAEATIVGGGLGSIDSPGGDF